MYTSGRLLLVEYSVRSAAISLIRVSAAIADLTMRLPLSTVSKRSVLLDPSWLCIAGLIRVLQFEVEGSQDSVVISIQPIESRSAGSC